MISSKLFPFLASLVLLMAAPHKAASENRLSVVHNSSGMKAINLGGSLPREITSLPIGTTFVRKDRISIDGKVTQYHYAQISGKSYIIDKGWSHCSDVVSDKRRYVKSRQVCLNKRGFEVGRPDGIWGQKTTNAIDGVLKDFGLRRTDVHKHCQLELACKLSSLSHGLNAPEFLRAAEFATMSAAQKDLRSKALRMLRNHECEDARKLDIEIVFGLDFAKCERDRDAWNQKLLAVRYFDDLKCEALSELPASARQARYSVEECLKKREFGKIKRDVQLALSTNDCDLAQVISAGNSLFTDDILACNQRLERQAIEIAHAAAVAGNNCQEIKLLEVKLRLAGGFENCRFAEAMSSETARQMFLAAGQYDASNDVVRAKLLYTEIVERFSEDDLALAAITRLTSLNDLERTEQARREMEAEMARLKSDAEAAQRRAEEAQRQAERARADAERRAAATASSKRRNSICGGRVSIGHGFPYYLEAFGVRLPQGDAVVIGINPSTQKATVRYMPAGGVPYTNTVGCSAIR